jgi:hypothetical protein
MDNLKLKRAKRFDSWKWMMSSIEAWHFQKYSKICLNKPETNIILFKSKKFKGKLKAND